MAQEVDNPRTPSTKVGKEDFFLIRSKGGTDISTSEPVTDEFRMFLDTDVETINENGLGTNLDIITTIASYAVGSFLDFLHNSPQPLWIGVTAGRRGGRKTWTAM